MKILALDYEGSHKNPRQGCPVQLGVAIMEGPDVLAKDEWLIKPPTHYKTGKPTREVDAYALRVSGLDLDVIERDGLASSEVCAALDRFVQEHNAAALTVVAYNISYDVECYGNMLYDGGYFDRNLFEYVGYREILSPKWMCAYRWARRSLANELGKFSLDDAAGFFGLSRQGELHGACEDAILAGRVFHGLAERGQVKAGAA